MPAPRLALVLLSAATTALAQQPTLSLAGADSLWARTYATNDTLTAAGLMADDIFITSSTGSIKNKALELDDIRASPQFKMKYFVTTDVVTRLIGTAGVVTGIAEWAFESGGTPRMLRLRYTAVYAKGGPLGWQLNTLHMGQAP